MKKLTVIALAVALAAFFAVSASANEWNLYGSARVSTFYVNQDNPDFGLGNVDNVGRDRTKNTTWDLQTNARIGAKVKGDMLSAQFEYGANTDSDLSDNYANVRRLYAVWHFSEGWGLKVGKDYTPITFFLSGQVFEADAGLLQVGNAYGSRKGQIALEGMGFKVAAIAPSSPTLTVTNPLGATFDVASEAYFPKLEASYELKFADAMSMHVFGGWSNYKLYYSEVGSPIDRSESINSYMVGIGGDFGFGPFWLRPQASYYRNGAAAGWLGNAIKNATAFSTTPAITDGSLDDIDSLMGMLAMGFKMSEALGFEAGIGYLYTDSKSARYDENTYLEAYLNAVIKLASSVYLVPEVGFRDFGDIKLDNRALLPDPDLGKMWYAGAKWQIDF